MLKTSPLINPLFVPKHLLTIRGYSGFSYGTRKYGLKSNKYYGTARNYHFDDMGLRVCLKQVGGLRPPIYK